MNNPNDRQVGGTHYGPGKEDQHWDMLPMCGYGWEYYKGRATAYLTRVKKPEEDTEKAGHFLEKLIWLIDTRALPQIFRPTMTPKMVILTYLRTRYFPANGIDPASLAAEAIEIIMLAQTRADLQAAIEVCAKIEHERLLRNQQADDAKPVWPFANQPAEARKGRWDDAIAAASAEGQVSPEDRVVLSIDRGDNPDMPSNL